MSDQDARASVVCRVCARYGEWWGFLCGLPFLYCEPDAIARAGDTSRTLNFLIRNSFSLMRLGQAFHQLRSDRSGDLLFSVFCFRFYDVNLLFSPFVSYCPSCLRNGPISSVTAIADLHLSRRMGSYIFCFPASVIAVVISSLHANFMYY